MFNFKLPFSADQYKGVSPSLSFALTSALLAINSFATFSVPIQKFF